MSDRPTVIFAYTIKAWRLATQGHPGNHSALLTAEQWEELAEELGADPNDPWALFEPESPEAELSRRAAERLERPEVELAPAPPVPADVGRSHTGRASTQQAFGRFFVDLAHDAPEVAKHVVTVSPDVASSTNLGGWINRVGRLAAGRPHRLVRRRHRHAGALARERARAAHRARHRRGQPRRAARRAGR